MLIFWSIRDTPFLRKKEKKKKRKKDIKRENGSIYIINQENRMKLFLLKNNNSDKIIQTKKVKGQKYPMKRLLIHVRTIIKFLLLVAISTVLVVASITLLYKPIYSVTFNGEFIRIYWG